MVEFEGYDIAELLLVLGVLTEMEYTKMGFDGEDDEVFTKAEEYFQELRHRACTDAGAIDDGVLAAFQLTKQFLRKLISHEVGTCGDADTAIFAVLLNMDDKEDFFRFCACLATQMWN